MLTGDQLISGIGVIAPEERNELLKTTQVGLYTFTSITGCNFGDGHLEYWCLFEGGPPPYFDCIISKFWGGAGGGIRLAFHGSFGTENKKNAVMYSQC